MHNLVRLFYSFYQNVEFEYALSRVVNTLEFMGSYRFLSWIKGSGLWSNRMGPEKEKPYSANLTMKKPNS